jgi:hypothetical protein
MKGEIVNRIEIKLSIWHRLYRELGDARKRMSAAASDSKRAELEVEVRRLQQESEWALEDVNNTAMSRERPAAGQPGRPT